MPKGVAAPCDAEAARRRPIRGFLFVDSMDDLRADARTQRRRRRVWRCYKKGADLTVQVCAFLHRNCHKDR